MTNNQKRFPMIEYMKRGPYDNIGTPYAALEPLLPLLDPRWKIWETAPGDGQLEEHLKAAEFNVVTVRHPFPTFGADPAWWDVIVTNPPFSQKKEFLKYTSAYGKPWALLLPVTTLGVGGCQPYLEDCQILFFRGRIDFTGKKAPWFAVAWFTWGLDLPKQLNFPNGLG